MPIDGRPIVLDAANQKVPVFADDEVGMTR